MFCLGFIKIFFDLVIFHFMLFKVNIVFNALMLFQRKIAGYFSVILWFF